LRKIIIILLIFFTAISYSAPHRIEPGAQRYKIYLPMLKGKRVGVFANQTSLVGKTHLVDFLLKHKIHVTKIFAPEHGFRGNLDREINNSVDSKTGLPIISLYGKQLKPGAEDLKNVDILLFDIQDVGVRFYTYISSLQKFMEGAAENHLPLIILDRPNPNGFYVDGPVLDLKFKSFTGMQPIPIVYGMTMGEYAKMLVGEEWLNLTPKSFAKKLKLTVIACRHYSHKSLYDPPVKPSPNLPSIQSIYWYPSIGLMEATVMSVGRGTSHPFQYFGHPSLRTHFTFTPVGQPWDEYPPYYNQLCHGWNLSGSKKAVLRKIANKLQIKYLIMAYNLYPDKEHFFAGFNYMAGNDVLSKQIQAGMSEKEIRQSWQPQLRTFKKIRKKYLLYQDFT